MLPQACGGRRNLFRKASAGVNTRRYQRSCFIDVQWHVPCAVSTVGGLGLFGGAGVVAGGVASGEHRNTLSRELLFANISECFTSL